MAILNPISETEISEVCKSYEKKTMIDPERRKILRKSALSNDERKN